MSGGYTLHVSANVARNSTLPWPKRRRCLFTHWRRTRPSRHSRRFSASRGWTVGSNPEGKWETYDLLIAIAERCPTRVDHAWINRGRRRCWSLDLSDAKVHSGGLVHFAGGPRDIPRRLIAAASPAPIFNDQYRRPLPLRGEAGAPGSVQERWRASPHLQVTAVVSDTIHLRTRRGTRIVPKPSTVEWSGPGCRSPEVLRRRRKRRR